MKAFLLLLALSVCVDCSRPPRLWKQGKRFRPSPYYSPPPQSPLSPPYTPSPNIPLSPSPNVPLAPSPGIPLSPLPPPNIPLSPSPNILLSPSHPSNIPSPPSPNIPLSPSPPSPSDIKRPLMIAYYESWINKHPLRNISDKVTHVVIAFMAPNNNYVSGQSNWQGTGLDFAKSVDAVKQDIAALKANNPLVSVLVSVGGASYSNYWGQYNPNGVADLVLDFGLDGVDIDYEKTPVCSKETKSCSTTNEIIDIIQRTRAALPPPYILSIAATGPGCYGEPPYDYYPLLWSPYAYQWTKPLKEAGRLVDIVSIMAYDLGSEFDPFTSYMAYKACYKGNIALGVQVPPESWGGYELTNVEMENLSRRLNVAGCNGIMLWALQKDQFQGVSAETITRIACNEWKISDNCDKPLFTENIMI